MTEAHEDAVPEHQAGESQYLPPPTEPQAPVYETPPERPRQTVAWIAAAIAIVAALLIAGSAPFWTPLLPWGAGGSGDLAARIDAAETARRADEARVARLESQVQQLVSQVQPLEANARNAAPATAVAALGDRVAALERRPDTAAQTAQDLTRLQQDDAGLATRLDAIEARLGKLAAAQSAEGGSDRMLFLALSTLRASIAGSGPYQGELAAVEALAHGDTAGESALQPLAATAQSGIPSTALLAARFANETAPAIFRAAATGPTTDTDWGQRILASLRSLVIISRVDGGGNPTEAAVARAKGALAGGDLAGAVTAVKSLTGAPADAAAPWLALAEQRLAAEAALDRLAQQVAQRMSSESR
jgi:hypothetical protein